MKKFYFLAMMALVALTTVSCSKDDDLDSNKSTLISSNSLKTEDSTSFYLDVCLNEYIGPQEMKATNERAALNAARTFFKDLLGPDFTIGDLNAYHIGFRILGKGKKAEISTKILKSNTTKLDEEMAKLMTLGKLVFTVYDSNNKGVATYEYKSNYDKVAPGTWNATLDNTKYTLYVSNQKDDPDYDYEYKATLKVGEKTYDGTFLVYNGNTTFKSKDKTLKLEGKFAEGFKTFTASINNAQATFSK